MTRETADQTIVVWGEVLWDRFPDGARLGGAPANVAWHAGQAGGYAVLISRVGDDAAGRAACDQLRVNVDVGCVQVDPARATGEVTVTLDGGEPRYRLVPGCAWERIAYGADAREAVGDAGVFVCGTLAQRTPDGLAAWRAAIADAPGVRAVDINLRAADRDTEATRTAIDLAIAACDVIKLNDKELRLLGEWRGWTDPLATLIGAGRRREAAAIERVIVVTHGADGSTLHTARGGIEIAPVRASGGGDNVGCGDAYLAILLHGLTLGWALEDSGAAASRWAAAVAGVRGATPQFDDDHIDALLAQKAA